MPYNKVLNISDYDDKIKSRKAWEIDLALKTLEDNGAVHPEANILGVGAGHERTIFDLSTKVGRVFASDLYLKSGAWEHTASKDLLANPAKFVPEGVDADLTRITFEHKDMLNLAYPDDYFDGVFSSGSIEHVGSLEKVAQAAAHIGRVTKPGGIISLSTEFKISGPGGGWPGILVLTPEDIQKYIVEPSGCELIDEPDYEVSEETLAHKHSLAMIVHSGKRPDIEVCLTEYGYVFTSVHVALRKPGGDDDTDTGTKKAKSGRGRKASSASKSSTSDTKSEKTEDEDSDG